MREKTGQTEQKRGRISQLGVLDLRNVKSMEELRHIEEISVVGTVLVSEDLQGSIASIPMDRVGAVVALPAESKVNRIGGTIRTGGELFERPAADGSDILLLTGEVIVTSPFRSVAYKQVIVTGELFIPRESESVLAPYLTQCSGTIVPCDHRNPRLFMGQGQFGKAFFEMMKEPVTLILMGEFLIESDVDPELLKEKTSEIILMGMLQSADRKLIPILQALTTVQQGSILPAAGSGDGWHGD